MYGLLGYTVKKKKKVLRFQLNLQLNTGILWTDIMLVYQPIEVLKSVLYLCKTLITTNSHMMKQSLSQ